MRKNSIFTIVLSLIFLLYLGFFFNKGISSKDLFSSSKESKNTIDTFTNKLNCPKAEVVVLIEKQFQGIKYKISSKMESEQNGMKVLLYDVVINDISIEENKIQILTEKIIKDILSHEDVNKIQLFFYSDESLIGERFDIAEVVWDSNHISIKMIQPDKKLCG